MEKMTLGCYQRFIKRSSLSWVGLVHNKEPPANMDRLKIAKHPKFTFQMLLNTTQL